MIDNPLAGAVRLLAPAARPREASWGVVTAVTPKVRVRLATPGEDTATDEAVLSLVPPWALSVGQKVRVSWMGRVMLLTHRTYGGADDHGAWTNLTPAAPWSAYTAFGVPRVRREGDRVEVEGSFTGGTGGPSEPLAVLPPWARPVSSTRPLVATAVGDVVDLRVNTSGALYLNNPMNGTGWALVPRQSFSV